MSFTKKEMKTRKREIKSYIIEWICQKDGCDGLMENSGKPAILCHPPKFIHKCNKCGNEVNSLSTYPKAKIEYVDEVE